MPSLLCYLPLLPVCSVQLFYLIPTCARMRRDRECELKEVFRLERLERIGASGLAGGC